MALAVEQTAARARRAKHPPNFGHHTYFMHACVYMSAIIRVYGVLESARERALQPRGC